jgi:hypothetical protein
MYTIIIYVIAFGNNGDNVESNESGFRKNCRAEMSDYRSPLSTVKNSRNTVGNSKVCFSVK